MLEKINRNDSGKLRKVISNIPLNEYAWKRGMHAEERST
jgi:hypothetical protein